MDSPFIVHVDFVLYICIFLLYMFIFTLCDVFITVYLYNCVVFVVNSIVRGGVLTIAKRALAGWFTPAINLIWLNFSQRHGLGGGGGGGGRLKRRGLG